MVVDPSTDRHNGAWGRLRPHVRGFTWTGLDQVLSSLSNVLVSLALARGGGAEALGIFTVAFSLYLIALGFLRSLVSEPVLTVPVENSGASDGPERWGLTTATTYLVAAAAIMFAIGLAAGSREIVLMGFVLPLVALQDYLRYLFFRRRRPEFAALVDGAWVIVSIAGWPLIVSSGSPSLAVLVWAAGGGIGILIGLAVSRAWFTSLRQSLVWWWRDIRPLGGFLAVSGVIFTVFSQITVIGLAAILGTADIGELSSARIIIGPVGLALTAFTVFALPRLSTGAAVQSERTAWLASGGAVALAGVSTAILWLLAPLLVPLLFGEAFEVPPELVLAVGVRTTLAALVMGPALVLKARQRGAPIAIGRLAGGVVGVPIVLVVAANLGLVPAVWAGNVGTVVNLLVLLLALRTTARLRSSPSMPAPG